MATVRFVPGPDQGDAEIVVLGVELHEELVVIDVATTLISAIRHPTRRNQLPLVRVEDDLGTDYRGKGLTRYGASWSGAAQVAHYPMEFRPPVPPGARFLRITFRGMYREDHSVVVMV